ncbi:MAG: hypothetical protein P3W94_003630 [Paracoccus sp. (in: a-proteobacteria)]|nr:hypothetical protein [Paracoccus sp. (in: a-proteobacteria)]
MSRFDSHGVQGGIWRGRLLGRRAPAMLAVMCRDSVVAEAAPVPDGEDWRVEIALPAEILSEGVQTLLLVAPGDPPEVLARLPLLLGRPLDGDLLSEIEALRAELDLVKRELRRIGRATPKD